MRDLRAPLHALTGVRFVAALAVVVHHFGPFPPGIFRNVAAAGFVGVDLFFMLSGFVLVYVYRPAQPFDVRDFLVARVARVYPLYVVALVAGAPLYFADLLFRRGAFEGLVRAIGTLSLHLTMTHAWVGHVGAWNVPDWSLSCEWAFYLAFPLVVPALVRARRPLTLAAALLVVGLVPAFLHHHYRPEFVGEPHPQLTTAGGFLKYNPLFRFHEFLVGALLAQAWVVRPQLIPQQVVRWAEPIVAGSAIIAFAFSPLLPMIPVSNGLFAPLWGFLILTLANGTGVLGRALQSRAAIVLGEASYATYLLHWPLWQWFSRGRALFAPNASLVVTFCVYLVVLVVLSIAAFRWIEVPFRARLRRLATRASSSALR